LTSDPMDSLDEWSLISMPTPGPGSAIGIHALGWRRGLRNTWITSVITAVDLTGLLVSTKSGKIYRLGRRGDAELACEFREHLRYALDTWGFSDIRER
jgi:hypothetical protein